ncbi:tRNA pseudouridine(55) synthase TruB [Candidatus Saccharibacteria bacterium]|nr:tRNA pseudouridine(55) synthase TruB [Candidatus Saccharibacteria bacterium]
MQKEEDQIILIDKPAGVSSFGVVARVRSRLKAEFGHKVKVGHTGTLDPFATGLLILLSGKNTKKSNDFLKKDKVYEATMKLGYVSSTGDPEGKIVKYDARQFQGSLFQDLVATTGANGATEPRNDGREGARPEKELLETVLAKFTGEISQIPPKFSAIKIGGRRAYDLARKNQDFELPSRKVTIYSIEILDYSFPYLTIRTHVSSGTYIRTLAEDIGKALGTGAYLTSLRRTKIANYDVKNATPLDEYMV